MKKKSVILVLLVCLLLPVLTACNSTSNTAGNSAKDITVAFIPKLTGSAFFDAANEGAQAYAKDHGFQVEYVGSPVADVANQIGIIEDLIEKKADAICVSSLDATALDDVLRRARTAGIKVVTWDSDVTGDARSLMVSQGTPDQLGKMLVEMGAKSLTDRGIEPTETAVRYAWHYSQATVTDQNSWHDAGEAYIKTTYPTWVNVAEGNYYSNQDLDQAVATGTQILDDHPDIDLIICNDSTALPGQAQALQNRGLTKADVTVTGFASPNAMREYCKADVLERWGLWDCQVQGALGCYLAYYLAGGNAVKVGDKIDVPQIGVVEVMPNTVLDPAAKNASDSGVVLLPSRTEYTIDNVDKYNF